MKEEQKKQRIDLLLDKLECCRGEPEEQKQDDDVVSSGQANASSASALLSQGTTVEGKNDPQLSNQSFFVSHSFLHKMTKNVA
mgnify:CR=1 FL=1